MSKHVGVMRGWCPWRERGTPNPLCTLCHMHLFHLAVSELSKSKVTQSCPTLCGPMDCSLPGSSLHGILQVRVLEWVAISSSRGSSQPRDRTQSPAFQADTLTSGPQSSQSCLTLCDPMDCSIPGSSVHKILQARILEWVAIPFSRRSSQPRD